MLYHANNALPWLGEGKGGDASEHARKCSFEYTANIWLPRLLSGRALHLKIEPRNHYFFIKHNYAVANTYVHKRYQSSNCLFILGKWDSKCDINDKTTAHPASLCHGTPCLALASREEAVRVSAHMCGEKCCIQYPCKHRVTLTATQTPMHLKTEAATPFFFNHSQLCQRAQQISRGQVAHFFSGKWDPKCDIPGGGGGG